MEINQAKRVEEAFEGVGAALASEFMLNLCSKHMCDPFGEFRVCMFLECENRSGRCKTWSWDAWQGSDPSCSQMPFWGVGPIPVGKRH